SGGTLAGVAEGLRARKPDVRIGIADPDGAGLYSYFTTGEIAMEGSSIAEGIGQVRITRNLEGLEVDFACNVPDEEGLPIIYDLLREEGLCLGLSSGINVAGAIRLAREMGPGHTIVTILCDYGTRYQSRLWNPEFMREKGLPAPDWLETRRSDLPDVSLPDEG
ncbi:MAG TPA: pyridoxal-phosphate dependent enzyme, partial [Paracoccaceae bacterium]|nr:pyridoxal-phosphate dependent enzyme [Paracoccaceae bacterium]